VGTPVVDTAAIHPISLRLHRLANNLVLAPMAGVSNLPFRLIAREAGAAMGVSETISAKVLVMGGRKTRRLLETAPREAPVAFQLFGAEPEVLATACRLLADDGVEWIDLNLGCPAPDRRCCATCPAPGASCAPCARASRERCR
jgi:tRNA-dihydrouridine synthase B